MNNKTTGLKNIAYALGLSINTVSRALRDCSDISESTKEKVRKKAYEMGYMPSNISQFIKRDGIKLVAIVINSLDDKDDIVAIDPDNDGNIEFIGSVNGIENILDSTLTILISTFSFASELKKWLFEVINFDKSTLFSAILKSFSVGWE